MVKKAHYIAGMNDFKYCVSLWIEHPNYDPDSISAELSLKPQVVHRAGDRRQTPKGRPLSGNYDRTYWNTEIDLSDGIDISESLAPIVRGLQPHQQFLKQLIDGGGVIQLFVGLFATGLCDYVLSNALLREFGDLHIDLRLDYYHS
jgi:hypothetical protein